MYKMKDLAYLNHMPSIFELALPRLKKGLCKPKSFLKRVRSLVVFSVGLLVPFLVSKRRYYVKSGASLIKKIY
jgi:hypothetical protein